MLVPTVSSLLLSVNLALGGPPHGQYKKSDESCHLPRNVDVFVQVDNADDILESLEPYQLRQLLRSALDDTELGDAWNAIAHQSDQSEEALFDDLLGSRFAFALRYEELDSFDWLIVTLVEPRRLHRILSPLKIREHAPMHGTTVRSLPEHSLMLARRGGHLFIAPLDLSDNTLFAEALALKDDQKRQSLASEAAMEWTTQEKNAGLMQHGNVIFYARHPANMGGQSIILASLADDTIHAKHHARFEHSPLGDTPPPTTFNHPALANIAETQLITFARPMEVPTGQLATFIRAQMPTGAITARTLDNVGERFMLMIGESQSKQTNKSCLAATLAIEVESSEHALADLDSLTWGFATFLETASETDLNIPTREDIVALQPDKPRTLAVGSAIDALFPAMTDVTDISFHWTVTSPDSMSQWWLISTHDDHLFQVADAMAGQLADVRHDMPLTVEVGIANPSRMAPHWDSIAKPLLAVSPIGERADLEATFEFLTAFSQCIDTINWQLDTPRHQQLTSNWTIRLRPRD